LYVVNITSGYFKSRSEVTYKIYVGSGRGRRPRLGHAKCRRGRALSEQHGPSCGRAKAWKRTAVASVFFTCFGLHDPYHSPLSHLCGLCQTANPIWPARV
jgi:hypothetical protein